VHYAIEGSVFIGGAVVQWLRDGLGVIATSKEVETLAKSVPSSDGVVFVPALTGLGAPYWDPHARGMLLGLTRGTNKAHIARAALEGIGFQVADILDIVSKSVSISELRVDGGAVSDNLLMQLQSNLTNLTLIRPSCAELTALGAAFLAGLSVGFWKDLDEIQRLWKEDKRFDPSLDNSLRKEQKDKWKEAVKLCSQWGEKYE